MLNIKHKILVIALGVVLIFNIAPSVIYAQVGQIKDGANSAAGQSGGTPARTLNDVIENVINVLSVIIGFVAVVMIIFAGFRYITAGGDSNKVGSAKSTLLYAIIGLFIVALAQTIAQLVVNKTGNPTSCVNGKIQIGPDKGKNC